MKALDFRTPLTWVEEQVVANPETGEMIIQPGRWTREETELTDEDFAQLAANRVGEITDEEISINRDRQIRDDLLLKTDWINGADVTLSDEKRAEYVTYRQALRDITTHDNWGTRSGLDIDDWPTKPT